MFTQQQKTENKSHDLQQEIMLITDLRILTVPIKESDEEMIDVASDTQLVCGPKEDIPENPDYTRIRKTIAEKLKKAQALLPEGIKLCLFEGYRNMDIQEAIFEEHFSHIQKIHPEWSYQNLFREATRLCSPAVNVDGSRNVPPHATGGAVDVYLVDDTGRPLDMGIHPKNWMADTDGTLSLTDSEYISENAKKNRRLMKNIMTAVGFVNYPAEYWHWSYGDRYWAYYSGYPWALYGAIAA